MTKPFVPQLECASSACLGQWQVAQMPWWPYLDSWLADVSHSYSEQHWLDEHCIAPAPWGTRISLFLNSRWYISEQHWTYRWAMEFCLEDGSDEIVLSLSRWTVLSVSCKMRHTANASVHGTTAWFFLCSICPLCPVEVHLADMASRLMSRL